MRQKVIAEYHQMLTMDDSLTAEFMASFKEMMRARQLVYGEREIGIALRPHLLTLDQFNLLSRSSEVVAEACNKVAAALLAEPWKMETVGLTEREIELVVAEPKYTTPAVTSRLDAFVHGNEIKFVEYNAENPSSLSDSEGLNDVLLAVGAMRTTAERYKLRQFSPVHSLLNVLLDTFHEWGGVGAPNIAILDWEGLPTAREFVLLQDLFVGRGVPTVICTPSQLEYENGKLRCGAFPIDLVYKRVIIHEFLARYDNSHPLIRAYLHGDVCLVNNFRCKMLHKKATFELLTDEASATWFTPDEREVIERTVPWTRRVAERKTQHGRHEVDLVAHVRKNRQKFVLKPNDDYGGRGISIGERATASEWDAAISEALAGDYVVQEKVELQTEAFPIFNDSGWDFQPMYVDTNPFLFSGRVEGEWCVSQIRLSSTSPPEVAKPVSSSSKAKRIDKREAQNSFSIPSG